MDADDGNGICFPYDVLLDILRRLPGRDVAASQCVCRSWRAMIDAHGLSLELYFPRRAFPGIFVNKTGCRSNMSFFAPPATDHKPGFLRPVFPHEATVVQSCNGLLLLRTWGYYNDYYVLNPATARSAPLSHPSICRRHDLLSLAFDPAVSLHYRVFLLHKGKPLSAIDMPGKVLALGKVQEGDEESKEKVLRMSVYSSCTMQWEDAVFTPGRSAPRHLYDLVARSPADSHEWAFRSSDYWRGSIYIHCHNDVLMILRPSKETYDMVQLPGEPCGAKDSYGLPRKSVLASYERGIHYVTINGSQLRVWMLTESLDGRLGWTMAHDVNLNPDNHMKHPITQPRVTWSVVGSNGQAIGLEADYTDNDLEDEDKDSDGVDGSDCSWNSDEDNFIDVTRKAAYHGSPAWGCDSRIAGFHPHKNALILMDMWTVVVYHLDTSKMQYLGQRNELMKDDEQQARCVDDFFTSRPCYKDLLLGRNFFVPT